MGTATGYEVMVAAVAPGIDTLVYNASNYCDTANTFIVLHIYTSTTCDSVLGLVETVTANSINVYPNPTHNLFYIEGGEIGAGLRLFNIVGQEVYTGTIESNRQPIDISNLPTGVYVLWLVDGNGVRNCVRVVKE